MNDDIDVINSFGKATGLTPISERRATLGVRTPARLALDRLDRNNRGGRGGAGMDDYINAAG